MMNAKLSILGLAAAAFLLSPVTSHQAWGTEPAASGTTEAAEVVRALYRAFEKGDVAAIEALIAPDATWTYYGPASKLPFGGTRIGPKGAAEFFAIVDQTLENPIATQRAIVASGDLVAVPGTEESTVRSTGIRYRADFVHLFKVRDGKIVQFEEFIDSGKVLLAFQGDASAGLSASDR